jgi:hypothetical protein
VVGGDSVQAAVEDDCLGAREHIRGAGQAGVTQNRGVHVAGARARAWQPEHIRCCHCGFIKNTLGR